MEIDALKTQLAGIESQLESETVVLFSTSTVNDRELQVYLTPQLKKSCKRKRIWKSAPFFITLKNTKYGITPLQSRSRGGRDGVFQLDRAFRPWNEMQRKIFDRFIDRKNSGFGEILAALGLPKSEVQAVRVVSHHMRLLGIHHPGANRDIIVLVDFDDTKH